MKISCPSCQSKYTIADEKVQGRSVKVRCRKCGETIHVTAAGATIEPAGAGGEAAAGQPSAEGAGDAGGSAFSVLVAEGDQRDMSVADIVAAYNSGLVTADTYVWGEGQNDWMPLGQVGAIVEAINQASAAVDAAREAARPSEPEPAPAAAPEAAAFAPQTAAYAPEAAAFAPQAAAYAPEPAAPAAGDLFGAAPVAQPVQHAAVREDRKRDVDLFGARKSDEDVATSAPPVRDVMAPGGATGTRDESSVLFSLSALTSAPSQGSSGGPGVSSSKDDSGLIDLKALALKADAPATTAAPMAASILDAAPLLGTPLIDMPAAQSTEAEPKKSKAPIFIGVGIGVAGIAIAAALFIGTRTKPAAAVPTGSPVASVTAAPTDTVATAPTATDSSGAAPPSTGAPSATAAKPTGGGKVPAGGKVVGKKGTDTGAAPATAATATAKTPPKSKCGCAPTDLACNMACAAK